MLLADGADGRNTITPDVLASWRRSGAAGIAPDGSGVQDVRRSRERRRRNRLTASVGRVLDAAVVRYRGLALCVLAADAAGFVIDVRGTQPALAQRLEREGLAVGRCVTESVAGTNALGSVLETGRAMAIGEGEHYLDRQKAWVAAGAPIIDPGVHRTIGALALICFTGPASPLLLADARELAADVGVHLADETDAADRAVLDAFVRARRRRRVGVLSVGRHILVVDRHAEDLLDGIGHAALWTRARELMATPGAGHALPLTDRALVRSAELVDPANPDAGVLLELVHGAATGPGVVRTDERTPALDGLVGRSPAWAALVREASAHLASRHPVLVLGEPGTGKASLAIAIGAARTPVAVIDCAHVPVIGLPAWLRHVREARAGSARSLLLRHLELLGDEAAAAVCSILETPSPNRMLGTINVAAVDRPTLASLVLELGVARIEIPPLRRRPDDIAPLATAMIGRHASRGYAPQLQRDTLDALMRYDWPGNVRELDTAVRGMLARRSIGPLRPDDLPREIAAARAGFALSAMQSIEKEAIAAALRGRDGNKVAAAADLGIARSTLYRKIRSYGLNTREVY